jgi:hypothetical protein
MIKTVAALLLACGPALLVAQAPVKASPSLHRTYRAGETLVYRMTGVNENWHYQIQADGIVKQDPGGPFLEEYRWSNLVSDNQKTDLTPGTAAFRQQLTLDPNRNPLMPDLAHVDPKLIGPITDFMTFYVDLWLAEKLGELKKTGDHFYFKQGTPQSWADGQYVILGQSSIDFDFTWKSVDEASHIATLEIRHVPPEKSQVTLTADWMHTPVADTPNNWVGVNRTQDGKFHAAVGKETFDVEIKVSLVDGKILSGSLDNVVKTAERECTDQALTQCSDPKPHVINRKIDIVLEQ